MIAVSKSAGATVANGALSFWVQNSATNLLIDPFAISFEITNEDSTSVMAKTALDLADAPTGSRVGLGHYADVWTPGMAAVGRYVVR